MVVATLTITRHADDLLLASDEWSLMLTSNRDDHTRQYSYLMDDGGEWRLSPSAL
ncbi:MULTISPECIES: hypothetical protein [Gluconobacter]|uniref:Uncharacterized protein n=1 Tax=Gluconobacter cerinus TaxID=38307 RepID=A0A1B6VFL5_9PROT|nr:MULTISPECIES: hypothetical protein [Gluconobacter]OAJ66022.1 hypothetical protein A0123_03349 [Gluconobacter cerinus]